MQGYIHSTESFGTVDGPGRRFVVFMQGCPLRCLYCHNPDTWEYSKGEKRTAQSIIDELLAVKEFLKGGGLTVTGGEPMVQSEFVTELFTLAKTYGIHTCLDTSGALFNAENTSKTDDLLKVTDLVMLDIKHIEPERHKALTGVDNANILAFAKYLADKGKPVWIRHVLVPYVTDDPGYLFALGQFIGGIKTLKALDVLPYHSMARPKYEALSIPYPLGNIPDATKEQAARARDIIMKGLYDRLKNGNKTDV